LARYFPRQDLVVYVEFDGLDAHRDAWSKTAAYRLLNETRTGVLYAQSICRMLNLILAKQPDVPATGPELEAFALHLVRRGIAVGINRAGGAGPPRSLGVVLRGGAAGQTRSVVEKLLRAGAGPRARVEQLDRPDGRKLHVLVGSAFGHMAWWAERDDLVVSVVSAGGPDVIIGVLENREPNAVEHPGRAALVRSEAGHGTEPVGVAFFDMAALPPLPSEAVALGLDGVKRLEYRWGFRDGALESIIGVVAPAPRRGISALFDQPSLDVRNLPPLPGGLAGFLVLSLDPGQFWNGVRAIANARPAAPGQIAVGGPKDLEDAVERATGVRLHEDLLVHLGSRFTFYSVPTKVNAAAHPLDALAQGYFLVPKMAMVIDVKNRDALAKSLEKLAEWAKRTQLSLPRRFMQVSLGDVLRLKGEDAGYVFSLNGMDIPFIATLRPTVLLGRKALVIASSPAMALQARDRSERSSAGGLPAGDPLAPSLDGLPEGLTLLSIDDTRQSLLPEILVGLPALAESILKGRRFRGLPAFRGFVVEEEVTEPGPVEAKGMAVYDGDLVPDPDALRAFLFPSVHVLAVNDEGIRYVSREAVPTINPATAVPVAIALLVPAVTSAQSAARRAQSINNLKQIGLAMHNFLSSHGQFPVDIRAKDGKPLLSWRVQILPFIEEQELFNSFRLDEAWDGPHNKALLERMPAAFVVPDSSRGTGSTFYRGFRGTNAIFDPLVNKGVGIQSITDGTSNTIAVVEAKEAVPWTKPESELSFEPDPKLERIGALAKSLGGHFPGGFNALFCDGSVRFIKASINLRVLQALITRNGGEVISSDSF
jgi:prepilin-type processing-associated H-X9-DG protein